MDLLPVLLPALQSPPLLESQPPQNHQTPLPQRREQQQHLFVQKT
jgi:hypothetical protein